MYIATSREARPETPAGTNIEDVIAAGPEAFRQLPEKYIGSWLAAHDAAFRAVFILTVALVALAFIGSWLMQTDGFSKRGGGKASRYQSSTLDLVATSPTRED